MGIVSYLWFVRSGCNHRLNGAKFTRISRLQLLASIFILFLPAIFAPTSLCAGISGTLRGAYDYGEVDDGAGGISKASNSGYSGEGALAYFFALNSTMQLHLGGFYFVDSSRTQKITSSSSSLQNFSISPTGYGLDLALKVSSIIMHAGYGDYKADARRVEDFVGRDYSLADGNGSHLGLGYILGSVGRFNFLTDMTYRRITYGKLQIKSAPGGGLSLENSQKWHQNLLSLGAGIQLTF
jgi:hypothetical protein